MQVKFILALACFQGTSFAQDNGCSEDITVNGGITKSPAFIQTKVKRQFTEFTVDDYEQQARLPLEGVQVLDGGSGRYPHSTCVQDAAQKTIENTLIAAQCCEADGTCRRFVGTNDAAGCIVGIHPNIVATNYAEAVNKCAEKGLQLCKKSCAGAGCNYNSRPVWTSKPCQACSSYTTSVTCPSRCSWSGSTCEAMPKKDEADFARFLMRASFGPTRESLAKLSTSNLEAWIDEQMHLPPSSHREYYRARVNSRYSAPEQPTFTFRAPCDIGSRWHASAFIFADKGKTIKIMSGKIYISSELRTEIDPSFAGNELSGPKPCKDRPMDTWTSNGKSCKDQEIRTFIYQCRNSQTWTDSGLCEDSCYKYGQPYAGDDCSEGWVRFSKADFTGYVCRVEGEVGMLVGISPSAECEDGTISFLPNPAIWFESNGSIAAETFGTFEANPSIPDVLFLKQQSSKVSCDATHLEISGRYYKHDARIVLLSNTPESPQQVRDDACAERSFVNEHGCVVKPAGSNCVLSCGSIGEIANDPLHGHMLPMCTQAGTNLLVADLLLDSRNDLIQNKYGKHTVWVNIALYGKDQLRQRMAWALSQILVVSKEGSNDNGYNEVWVGYYDIFVRHAFGNYRDVLREVTYSPMMGHFLTYIGSSCYDFSRRLPDENYAREIMQLFTIGVEQLNPDGTVRLDAYGSPIPTYDNDHIVSLARIFTGFKAKAIRNNVEVRKNNNDNFIDPMDLLENRHDIYPKPNLYDGYIGDQYPLCIDLPRLAFLASGSRYEFFGYSYDGDVLAVDHNSSALYEALCGRKGASCAFVATVTLESDIPCFGEECNVDSRVLHVVQVSDGFYRYVPPPCVFLSVFSGQLINFENENGQEYKTYQEVCADKSWPFAGAYCCGGCKNEPTNYMKDLNITCENAETTYVNYRGEPRLYYQYCNRHENWRTRKYCQYTCWLKSPEFDNLLAYDGDNCSFGYYSTDNKCGVLHEQMSLNDAEAYCAQQGMSICADRAPAKVCGSSASGKASHLWRPDSCSLKLQVHEDGKVSVHSKRDYNEFNRFKVFWSGDAPALGEYDAVVDTQTVFEQVPSKQQLLSELKIGAFAPTIQCTHGCNTGDVKAYAPSGKVDGDTIFECENVFYKNVVSIVQAGGGKFRNPPSFMQPGVGWKGDVYWNGKLEPPQFARERMAANEVESLLDHIFHHPNTPVFVGKKLIQRFVNSNPTPDYIRAVAEAFASGTYDGRTYSGKYGDLAATVAAILLHPDGETQEGSSDGGLRSPMLKVMHLMRSMELTDDRGQQVVLKDLQDLLGQYPYSSPSVFNFFEADYKIMPADGESVLAPEFQIFTPPLALGMLNALEELIQYGLAPCMAPSTSSFQMGRNRESSEPCSGATLRFVPLSSDPSQVVEELDILMTGGRLTPASKEVVLNAMAREEDCKKFTAAKQAMVLTPEFHTLGKPRLEGKRLAEAPTILKEPSNYKALVLLFLHGGADTFQMLVPTACKLYEEYLTTRASIALKESELIKISAPTQTCQTFGVHPKLSYLAQLYNAKEAAFVTNIGSLVEPVTRTTIENKTAKLCAGTFSHSHQQASAQTLKCQGAGGGIEARGVAGRMSDILAAKYTTTSFSIAGTSIWSRGFETRPEILDKSGAIRYQGYRKWSKSLSNITGQLHGNIFAEEYAKLLGEAIESSERLGGQLDDVGVLDEYPTTSLLAKQLHQVARLIATREVRKAERDFFFVQLGGFDTHTDITTTLNENFKIIDDSLNFFVSELKRQKDFDKVTLITQSDFGRTLTTNGQGTDHGWGGQHLIVGGGIKGGAIFNDFPETMLEGGEYLTPGRCRVIPQYPWESMLVPIAEWMGVTEPHAIFPNLNNFDLNKHIIAGSKLFNL